jgi:hypothetical protein
MSGNRRIAIMGGSESGKTALAIGLSRGLWSAQKTRTLAFDPYCRKNDWGGQAWVTDEFLKFQHVVFRLQGFAAFWDEGTSTGGRDRDKVKFFTAIRHNSAFFAFMGHDHTTMLPIMRGSLTDVILFRQSETAAAYWADLFTDRDLLRSTDLPQYAAMHKRAFRPVRSLAFSEADLKKGVTL